MKSMCRALIILITANVALIFCTACQPTPAEDNVKSKADHSLLDMLEDVSDNQENEFPEKWTYRKSYDSGIYLEVDAVIRNAKATNVPVVSLERRKFEDGDSLKRIVEAFYPNQEVYEMGEDFSKSEIEEFIIHYKNLLSRLERGLPLYPEEGDTEPTPEDRVEMYKDTFTTMIKDLEERHNKATVEALDPAVFQLRYIDDYDSYQANLWTKSSDNNKIYIDFVNWSSGASSFYIEVDNSLKRSSFTERFLFPEALEADEDFIKVREAADKLIQKMGLDYMALNYVSKNPNTGSYNLYYTRIHQGLYETFVDIYFVASDDGIDNAEMINLWRPEYLHMEVLNNEIIKARWENTSQITNVDNNNVKTISWEEVQDIFVKQIDYVLSASIIDASPVSHKTVYIDRVEFGLTKVLMRNSRDDYKLVPSWNFLGYETATSGSEVSSTLAVCYLTINAIDGTVINRRLMH